MIRDPELIAMDEAGHTKTRKDRTWLYVGLAFVVFWICYLAFFSPKRDPNGGGAPRLEGTGLTLPADYNWKLMDLEGRPTTLGAYRGRPIVLNLWATWCAPCRVEMPSLSRLASNPKLAEVAFLGVSGEESVASVKRYAATGMQGLTVLRARDLPEVFASDGIPATFIIDRDGAVVASDFGAASWDDPSVVKFLEGLIANDSIPR